MLGKGRVEWNVDSRFYRDDITFYQSRVYQSQSFGDTPEQNKREIRTLRYGRPWGSHVGHYLDDDLGSGGTILISHGL